MQKVDLAKFNNSWYQPGNAIKRLCWYFCNFLFFHSWLPYPNGWKRLLLSLFGCKLGTGIVIKPRVNIKYPWLLEIGDNTWLGEDIWIDNLAEVKIGANVCISQGAYLLTGNHDYKKVAFDLIVSPILIEDGVWVGAKVVVCPGAILRSHCVITAGSVIAKEAQAFTIYSGNLAQPIRKREINQ